MPGVSVPGWNLSVDVCTGLLGELVLVGGALPGVAGGAGNELEPGHWHKSALLGSAQLPD